MDVGIAVIIKVDPTLLDSPDTDLSIGIVLQVEFSNMAESPIL